MDFSARLISWQKKHGRHNLPWQQNRGPYAIWLSEIMLQQTQVATVIPYYLRFLARFPNISSLAQATEDEVLSLWSGLGYYSRARNLHLAAQIMLKRHNGEFPNAFEQILALPGIGRSTAAAICSFAFGQRHAILDGNVKRVLARYGGINGHPGDKPVADKLWQQAEALLPQGEIEAYTQGLMDLGSRVCTRSRPVCTACPVMAECVAHQAGRVAELPTPRPKKVLPEKHTAMWLLIHNGEVFLEKRPAPGIWGGLWSLPEGDPEADAERDIMSRYGVMVKSRQPLPPLEHGFSHYKLCIAPLLLHVGRVAPQASQAARMWIDLEDAQGAALPAPVKKLLTLATEDLHGQRPVSD
ncbi:MAG: A/G-specific adenine glycosylase [Sulfuricellaceae bacterium]|nr:A/G-specific adenine glycosylase [Sulfuricellaceae bacterium]